MMMIKLTTDNSYTIIAAVIRPSGIVILFMTNHNPAVSDITNTSSEKAKMIPRIREKVLAGSENLTADECLIQNGAECQKCMI